MTKEELIKEINEAMNNKPIDWRNGQFVFNYIDKKYDVARRAQFEFGIDCFYNDTKIDVFIDCCSKIINEKSQVYE